MPMRGEEKSKTSYRDFSQLLARGWIHFRRAMKSGSIVTIQAIMAPVEALRGVGDSKAMRTESYTFSAIFSDGDGGRPGEEGSLSGETEATGKHDRLLSAVTTTCLVQEAEEGAVVFDEEVVEAVVVPTTLAPWSPALRPNSHDARRSRGRKTAMRKEGNNTNRRNALTGGVGWEGHGSVVEAGEGATVFDEEVVEVVVVARLGSVVM
ncbi:hypothetical protein SESBI_29268 [Sesbania bispinosa]|nr:hypothetical protein SESBI_29268 [Sesbania bispinosa]